MAIAYLKLNAGQKAKGHSALAKSRYIARLGRYSKLDPVIHSGSGNLPPQFKSMHQYWKAADEHERSNAIVYREAIIALPVELSEQDRIAAAKEIAKAIAVSKTGEPLAYQFALHKGKKEDEEQAEAEDEKEIDNPHVHIMISERIDDLEPRAPEVFFKQQKKEKPAEGGAPKMPNNASELKKRTDYMKRFTEQVLNRYLDNEHQIDFKAHEKSGKIPQVHLGPVHKKVLDRYVAWLEDPDPEREVKLTAVVERYLEIKQYNANIDRLAEIEQEIKAAEKEIEDADLVDSSIDKKTVNNDKPSEIRTHQPQPEKRKEPTHEERVQQLNSQKSLREKLLAAQKSMDAREKQEEEAMAKVVKGNPSRSRQDPDPGL